MARDIAPHNRATLRTIEAIGYRVGIGEQVGQWIATAKRDNDGQFHIAKGENEDETVAALAELVGIELEDG